MGKYRHADTGIVVERPEDYAALYPKLEPVSDETDPTVDVVEPDESPADERVETSATSGGEPVSVRPEIEPTRKASKEK